MPSLLSLTPLREPAVVDRATAAPPVVSGVPDASRNSTVIVDVLDPSAGIEVGEEVIWDVAPDGGPGPKVVKVTVALSSIASLLTSPVIVAVPGVDGDVSVAV